MSEQNTQQTQSSLEQELNKLGENLSNLFKALWDSEERKSLERELTAGVESANKALVDAVEKVRTDQTAANVKQNLKEAWESARGPQILSEIQTGITNTLHRVNEEISKRSAPAQEVKPDAPAAQTVVEGTATEVKPE
jgi:hypothetical protein